MKTAVINVKIIGKDGGGNNSQTQNDISHKHKSSKKPQKGDIFTFTVSEYSVTICDIYNDYSNKEHTNKDGGFSTILSEPIINLVILLYLVKLNNLVVSLIICF